MKETIYYCDICGADLGAYYSDENIKKMWLDREFSQLTGFLSPGMRWETKEEKVKYDLCDNCWRRIVRFVDGMEDREI